MRGTALAPDIEIFHKAVHYALAYNEFFRPEEIGRARELLSQGRSRAAELSRGQASWPSATGLVVRGFVSRIDRSVQPYALVVPPSYKPDLPWKYRLDVWFHGRSENLSEVNFLYDRQRNPGEFAPPNTFVLHVYGRYCNGSKFAGETDLFEALDAVKKAYPIDEERISVRGFSLGGASTWHIAAHHAGLWAAAAPGAGFSETPEFLRLKPADLESTPWWEQRLWRLYNATDYAENLFNLPVVAYSGEIDRQKQAADIMARSLEKEGIQLRHIIGPQTAHRYHPDSKIEINNIIDPIVARGRKQYPKQVRFTTYTLRYNRMKWVVVDALERHWQRARVEAEVSDGGNAVEIRTSNIREFHLDTGPGSDLVLPAAQIAVVIDGSRIAIPGPMSDGSWTARFRRAGDSWKAAEPEASGSTLRKRHGLQGPIDDAFLEPFLFVVPSGESTGSAGSWVKAEQERAIREWRRQWRGDALVKKDTEVTEADIANHNLVLWGDATSNQLIARMKDRLPVKWSAGQLSLGKKSFSAETHIPILIYPNPLHPDRYVVLNSGPTQREFDYLNNARQVPRLPDYAIVDTTTPPDEKYPGKIVAGGLFNDDWALEPDDGKGK